MPSCPDDFSAIATACQHSRVGKLLPDALYVHISALSTLDPLLQAYEDEARQIAAFEGATLVKFSLSKPSLSYLVYPDFDIDPHPALLTSVQVDLVSRQVTQRDYGDRDNPFILHRKETFVTPDYPHYQQFAALTRQEEALGLLDQSRSIGTRLAWEQRLVEHRVALQGHTLVQRSHLNAQNAVKVKIERHKAAISRNDLSKPMRLALEAGLFSHETIFFDYGCGQGGDIERVAKLGYTSAGWDPHYRPETPLTPADVINLGYVINVIESQAERREALLKAWELTGQVLIVAAQVLIAQGNSQIAYEDGVITSRNTFQKYYDQEELKLYIDQVLGVDAVPVALGIYFVFRDEAQAQSFRASRFRSRVSVPRIRLRSKRFEDYQELLAPLMAFVTERGRLPTPDELPAEALTAEFGTMRRAFQVVLQATNPQEWDAIADRRRHDLLIYLALSHFGHRPKLRDLTPVVQTDIRCLFGGYQQACTAADLVLMSLGNLKAIAERCLNSAVGQKRPNSLWVHVSVIETLDPLLRLYEGCASRTIGRPETANVVKFHMHQAKITYLFYPEFDTDPHPALHTSMQIDLRDLHVQYRDYNPDENPPLLHQKDQLVTPEYPFYEKFAKLSRQEEDWGLLDNLKRISDRQGWLKCLEDHCAELKGHRVVWRKDANPYQMKLVRSAIRSKQARM